MARGPKRAPIFLLALLCYFILVVDICVGVGGVERTRPIANRRVKRSPDHGDIVALVGLN